MLWTQFQARGAYGALRKIPEQRRGSAGRGTAPREGDVLEGGGGGLLRS